MPLDGGFLVRNLRTLQTCVTFHISVVTDPLVRLPQLLLSDKLLRTHGRLAGQAGVIQEATRALYAASPLTLLADPRLVLLDPLTKLPRALVPAVGEDGSLLLVDEHTWPLDEHLSAPGPPRRRDSAAAQDGAGGVVPRQSSDLASPRTPGRRAEAQGDDGSVEWAAELAASTPAPAKGSSAYLRALPLTTRVTFAQDASKRAASKSQARFARYKTATTLLELQQLNPSKFMADLKFDYEKKLITIEPEDPVFRALLVAAPPAPLTLGTAELGDFVARGGERGFS